MIKTTLLAIAIGYLVIGLSLAMLLLGLGLFTPPPTEKDARPAWMRGPIEDKVFAFCWITLYWPKLQFNHE